MTTNYLRLVRRAASATLLLAAVTATSSRTYAAIISYTGASSGNWTTGPWSPTGQPPAGSDVQIITPNTLTVTYNSSTNPLLNSLTLDSSGSGSPTLSQSQGTLSDLNTTIGNSGSATYTQSAGTHNVGTTGDSNLVLGNFSGSKGTYNLSGSATLTVHDGAYIGYGGSGSFNQSGGTFNVTGTGSIIYLAHTNAGSVGQGSYTMTGGSMSVHQLDVGEFGAGTFTHSAGTVTVDKLYLAYDDPGASGTYTLSGSASLVVNQIAIIAGNGPASFIQNGGSSSIASTLYISNATTPSVVGSYQLNSGQLSDQSTIVGQSSIGTFTQTGGSHTISTALTIAANSSAAGSSYNFQGGTLTAPQGIFVNAGGTLALSGPGTRTLSSPVSNSGTVKTTATIANYTVTFTNNSAYISNNANNNFTTLSIGSAGYLTAASSADAFVLADDLSSSSTQSNLWSTASAQLHFVNDPANSSHSHNLSLNSADLGATASGYLKNFAWGTLTLDSGQSLALINSHSGSAALYLTSLSLAGGTSQLASIQSNGLKIYYNPNTSTDAYLLGKTYSLTGGGSLVPLPLSVPEPASLALLTLAAPTLLRRRPCP